MDQLKLDIQEIDTFLDLAQRKVVIDCLQQKKKHLESELLLFSQKPKQVEQTPVQEESKQQEHKVHQEDNTDYTPITKYSWEQEGKQIKVFFLLDKVGQVPKENIIVHFQKQSIDLRIKDYNGQNLRFTVKKLQETIDASNCKLVQKNNSIILNVKKSEQKNWETLQYKESPIKTDKLEKEADPQASLMNMMKEMYQNGDDEMKKTIAQAWSKSAQEKGMKM